MLRSTLNQHASAFPSAANQTDGLSKREILAALAMQGLASRDFPPDLAVTAEAMADQAVDLADALLRRLARG